MKDIVEKAKAIDKQMSVVENELYQTKNKSRQDPLNYPIKLTNKLAHLNSLMGIGDGAPTKQAEEFRQEVTQKIDMQVNEWKTIKDKDIPELNRMVREKQVDAIMLDSEPISN